MIPLGLPIVLVATAPATAVEGTWILDGQPDLQAIFREAASALGPREGAHALEELVRNNPVARHLTLRHTRGRISVGTDARGPLRMPEDGRAVSWTREDGRRLLVSARFEGDRMVHTLLGEDGMRETAYAVEEGTLVARVTIKAMKLAAPVHYLLRYHRAP